MNDNTMYCRQWQETFGNNACTRVGVCGIGNVVREIMD